MVLLSWLTVVASATTWNVPVDFPTVRDAVTAAVAGDVIEVDGGAYVTEDLLLRIPVDKDLTIVGIGAAVPRVPGFDVVSANLSLANLTIRAGYEVTIDVDVDCPAAVEATLGTVTGTDLTFERQDGFAFEASTAVRTVDSTVTLDGVTAVDFHCVAPIFTTDGELNITDGSFSETGLTNGYVVDAGAVKAMDGTLVTLDRVTVTGRVVGLAGGLYGEGGTFTVRDSSFVDNVEAGKTPAVGAIYVLRSDLLIERTEFVRNVGEVGAVYSENGSGVTIVDSTFLDNDGNLIGDVGLLLTPADISGSTFTGGDGSIGGSLYANGSVVDVMGSSFDHTTGFAAVAAAADSSIIMTDTDILEASGGNGGAINASSSYVSLTNGNLLGNRAGTGGAIYLEDGEVLIDGVDVDYTSGLMLNASTGALVAVVGDFGTFTALDSRLANGDAKVGGAIYSLTTAGSTILLDGVLAENNYAAVQNFYFGMFDDVTIHGSDFRNNTAGDYPVFYSASADRFEFTCNRVCNNVADNSLVAFADLTTFTAGRNPTFVMKNNVWFGNGGLGATGGAPISLLLNAGTDGSVVIENNTIVDESVDIGFLTVLTNLNGVTVLNNIFGGLQLVQSGTLSAAATTDYNLYYNVGGVASDPDWTGPNDLMGTPTYQGYVPGDCDSNLWLDPSSLGVNDGSPLRTNLDGTQSSVGAYGGLGACLNDGDGDGSYEDMDCDDADPTVSPNASEICDEVDNDCDGLVDDDDPSLDGKSGDLYYTDADSDGYGEEPGFFACVQPAGTVTVGGDCNGKNPDINPGAVEICDLLDNDCDLLTDDADPDLDPASASTFYLDGDGDGFGDLPGVEACSEPEGGPWVGNGDDCDDTDRFTNPNANEVCDGEDDDCDLLVDDADPDLDVSTTTDWYTDADGDGFGDDPSVAACEPPTAGGPWVSDGTDCDDGDIAVNPAATEACNGYDDDCDTRVDSADPSLPAGAETVWYLDADGDGYGDGPGVASCDEPAGGPWSTNDQDCDDSDPAVNPAALEVCNGIDDDCDTLVDDADGTLDSSTATTWYADTDGDGYGDGAGVVSCEPPAAGGPWTDVDGDCDDTNGAINPSATEICDPLDADEDCDTLADDADTYVDPTTTTVWYTDADGDGFGDDPSAASCEPPDAGGPWVTDDTDCDDADGAVNPAATEICDTLDNDCDDLVDDADPDLDPTTGETWYVDADGDGYGDGPAIVACEPAAGETWVTTDGDCDDAEAAVNPGADELCDGLDNDCDTLIDTADDDLDPDAVVTWYEDVDGDGVGDEASAQDACEPPADGWVTEAGDCDDADPELIEICEPVVESWIAGGCSCDTNAGPTGGAWLAALGALAALRRRRG